MNHAQLDDIFNASSFIEAVIQLSRDGLPLAWRCRFDSSVEEITSIVAGLFTLGFELELISQKQTAQLLIETDNGAMLVRTIPDDTFILILSARGCPVQELEMKLDQYGRHKKFNLKEVHNG